MKRILAEIPKPVVVSALVLLGALLVFAALLPTLGAARDEAVASNAKLKSDIEQTTRNVTQAKADQTYVHEHQQQFEALISGDLLVPHTRRAAVVELNNAAHSRGLSALNYNFVAPSANSLATAQRQPQSGAFSVSVENIDLKIGAPTDGAIYRFISDINASFPGVIAVESFELKRAPEITSLALELVNRGQDSQLVTGDLQVSWRTAQAQDKKAGGNKK